MSIQTFELRGFLDDTDLALLNVYIGSFDLDGDYLFVGTRCGKVIQFLINSTKNGSFSNIEHINGCFLGIKKTISFLYCSVSQNRIIALLDGLLYLVNLETLGILHGFSSKVKNICCVAVNESQVNKSSVLNTELILGTLKKNIVLCSVSDDRMIVLKQVSVTDIPISIAIDSWYVVFADSSSYYHLDFSQSNSTLSLFPYDSGGSLKPFVKKLGPGEFILNGPNALGVFVSSEGISNKPPLKWSPSTFSVAYSYPYILALDDEFLTIHSILDQIQKQSIPSPSWAFLSNTAGKVLVGSKRDLLFALPLSPEKQIESLVEEARVEEAITLLANLEASSSHHSEEFYAYKRRIERKCGLLQLRARKFSEAQDLLMSSEIELNCLLGMWPSLTDSTKSKEFNIDDEIAKSEGGLMEDYSSLYIRLLGHLFDTGMLWENELPVCSKVLLKLHAANFPEALSEAIGKRQFAMIPLKEVESLLKEHSRFHALAVHYMSEGFEREAVELWQRLLTEALSDPIFPGISFFIDKVKELKSEDTLWQCVEWLLTRSHIEDAISILQGRVDLQPSGKFYPLSVSQLLVGQPLLNIRYLESVAGFCDSRVNLALCRSYSSYFHSFQDIEVRNKCRDFLSTSKNIEFSECLKLFDDSCCMTETVIILRRLARHEEALHILVEKVQSTDSAMDYCQKVYSDSKKQTKLFDTLLQVISSSSKHAEEEKVSVCLKLLELHCSKMTPLIIIQWLPGTLDLTVAAPYLHRSLVSCAADSGTQRLVKSALVNRFKHYKRYQIEAEKLSVEINDSSICAVCKGPFFEPTFVLYPNKVIVHTSCNDQASQRLLGLL